MEKEFALYFCISYYFVNGYCQSRGQIIPVTVMETLCCLFIWRAPVHLPRVFPLCIISLKTLDFSSSLCDLLVRSYHKQGPARNLWFGTSVQQHSYLFGVLGWTRI